MGSVIFFVQMILDIGKAFSLAAAVINRRPSLEERRGLRSTILHLRVEQVYAWFGFCRRQLRASVSAEGTADTVAGNKQHETRTCARRGVVW